MRGITTLSGVTLILLSLTVWPSTMAESEIFGGGTAVRIAKPAKRKPDWNQKKTAINPHAMSRAMIPKTTQCSSRQRNRHGASSNFEGCSIICDIATRDGGWGD